MISNRNIKRISTFTASITLGLQDGYTSEQHSKAAVIKAIQLYQARLIKARAVYLSVSISECEIVLSGQREPHLTLAFINYPRFEMATDELKKEVLMIGEYLMDKFHQNRIVTVFNDETVMLENNDQIDPRINENNTN